MRKIRSALRSHPAACPGAMGIVLLASLVLASPARAASVQDIIVLCRSGVSADIVIQTLRADPALPRPTPEILARLRAARVPEAVIRFLQRRAGQRPGGAAHAPSASGRAIRDEARRQEAARLREEARRLRAEAARLARAARGAAVRREALARQVQTALDAAFSALRHGAHFRAISRFSAFLGSGMVPPNSFAYLEATYGLARAYLGAGMLYSAAESLVAVIRRGPRTPRFAAAVTALGRVLETVNFVHPVVALLATFERDVQSQPAAWRDGYHYLLGAFYERYDEPRRALHHFGRVSAGSPRYPAARYHMGVLETARKRARTGARHFRTALAAARKQGNVHVAELATLALARLAFEVGSYGAARHLYGQIPRRSLRFARAQYELAWTHVMSERYAAALGTIHGLHSPFFRPHYLPDLLVLEAAVYLNLCHYQAAQQTLARFAKQVVPAAEAIRKLLDRRPSPAALRRAARRAAASQPSPLPPLGLRAVLGDLRFYEAYKSYRQARREEALARRFLRGAVRRARVRALASRRAALAQRVGLEIRRRLRDVLVQLDTIKVKADEIGLEVELGEKTALEARRRALAAGRAAAGAARKTPTRGRAAAPARRRGRLVWPAQSEYWLDEIGAFRSSLRSLCPRPTGRSEAGPAAGRGGPR